MDQTQRPESPFQNQVHKTNAHGKLYTEPQQKGLEGILSTVLGSSPHHKHLIHSSDTEMFLQNEQLSHSHGLPANSFKNISNPHPWYYLIVDFGTVPGINFMCQNAAFFPSPHQDNCKLLADHFQGAMPQEPSP